MHLVGPYMTTTNYKKRKQKGLTKKDKQAKIEHDKWLTKMGVHPDQLAEKKAKQKNEKKSALTTSSSSNTSGITTSDIIPAGSTAPKQSMKYSGERKLLGIATMHKSNMVPVFADKKEDAKDIANMRRG